MISRQLDRVRPKWEKGLSRVHWVRRRIRRAFILERAKHHLAVISGAPLPKLEAYKALRGWTIPWYSSFDSDINYDFHVTLDENVASREYNYRSAAELDQRMAPEKEHTVDSDTGRGIFCAKPLRVRNYRV
jgi:predicted dithiol-disulfide oxidoreductase (DUF899 family)